MSWYDDDSKFPWVCLRYGELWLLHKHKDGFSELDDTYDKDELDNIGYFAFDYPALVPICPASEAQEILLQHFPEVSI